MKKKRTAPPKPAADYDYIPKVRVFLLKEMSYRDNSKFYEEQIENPTEDTLLIGEANGYKCYICGYENHHMAAYVVVPKVIKNYVKQLVVLHHDWSFDEEILICGNTIFKADTDERILGCDFSRIGDYTPCTEDYNPGDKDNRHKWTVAEVFEQIERATEKISILEKAHDFRHQEDDGNDIDIDQNDLVKYLKLISKFELIDAEKKK